MYNSAVRRNIWFPRELNVKINVVSKKLNTDASKFVREAVEDKLRKIEQEILSLELAQGYSANAKLDKETCDDFKYIDGENI